MANRNAGILRQGFNAFAQGSGDFGISIEQYTFQIVDGSTVIDHVAKPLSVLSNSYSSADNSNGTLSFDTSQQGIVLENNSGSNISDAVIRVGTYTTMQDGPQDPISNSNLLFEIHTNDDLGDSESFTLTSFTVNLNSQS